MAAASGLASASSISYNGTTTVTNANTPFVSSIQIQEFNPSLGTLTGVTFELTGAINETTQLGNIDPNVPLTGASASLTTGLGLADSNGFIVGATPSYSYTNVNLGVYAGDGLYDDLFSPAASWNQTFTGNTPIDVIRALTDNATLSLFTGTGPNQFQSVSVSGTDMGTSGGGSYGVNFLVAANAAVKVTYTYNASQMTGTPEPGTMFLLGSALAGLGLLRRRFVKK